MLFTSLEFLFLFLPVTLAVYFAAPKRLRNYWLLAVSLLFYAWGEPVFLFFMLASILFNYLMALGIDALKPGGMRKALLAAAVSGNLSLLFVYKYMNFFTETVHRILPQTRALFPVTEFALPIGISFFTFQAMSYVIDVYRGGERGAQVQKNPAYVALYVSFFPQLIAGPIVRYTTIEKQIEDRTVTLDSFALGVYRFLLGFNKKMLLANKLAIVADAAFAARGSSVAFAWLGMLCYTLQIYYDFSGYSEMAIGLGKMFGFDFLENFDYPYISKTVGEFWRRWHMSLGTWFRDYVYFPLGGSRVKTLRRLILNTMIVWLLTGAWHGAQWTYVLWGVSYGVLITVEKLLKLPQRVKRHAGWSAAYQVFTMLMVMMGMALFRSTSLTAALRFFLSLVGVGTCGLTDALARYYARDFALLIAAGMLCATPVPKRLKERLMARRGMAVPVSLLAGAVQLALFVVGVSQLVMNAHNPFIYFNF